MNSRKGFTLVEVLGVVVIIAALSLLLFPNIMNQFQNNQRQISEATKTLIQSASNNYVDMNQNDYPKTNGNVYCITLEKLVNFGSLTTPIMDASTGKEIDLTNKVKVSVKNSQFHSEYIADNSCTEIK